MNFLRIVSTLLLSAWAALAARPDVVVLFITGEREGADQ
jgi:hypothetical protein